MSKTIAKVYGTAIAPGVSRNGRLYTPEVIAKAVKRAQTRLGDMVVREMDAHPMAQRTHHASEDDSTAIVGRVVALTLAPDGRALFEAHLADTESGRTIAELVDTSDGPPFLRGVSIRGAWLGETYRTQYDGQMVETADDLEIDGLDYTHKPGVPGALIDRVERTPGRGARESAADGRTPIYESVQEARVTSAIEETTPAPNAPTTEGVMHADPGYRGDPRWPLGTITETAAAWSALQDRRQTADYSSRQLKRMRARTSRAVAAHGLLITPEGHLLQESATRRGEVTEALFSDDRPSRGSVSAVVTDGKIEVAVRAYGLDSHDVALLSRRAMEGAAAALSSMDAGDMDTAAADAPLLPVETADEDETTESGGKFVPFKKGQNKPGAAQKATGGKADAGDDEEDEDETEESGFVPFKKGQNKPGQKPKSDDAEGDDEDDEDDEDTGKKKGAKGKKPWESVGSTANTKENAAVAETSNTVPTVTLSADQFAALLAQAGVTETAETAEVTETEEQRVDRLVAEKLAAAGVATGVVEETDEQRVQRLVDEGVQRAIGDYVQRNGVPRKGLAESANGGHRGVHGGTITQAAGVASGSIVPGFDRPLHQLSDEEWSSTAGVAIERYVMGSRSVHNQA